MNEFVLLLLYACSHMLAFFLSIYITQLYQVLVLVIELILPTLSSMDKQL